MLDLNKIVDDLDIVLDNVKMFYTINEFPGKIPDKLNDYNLINFITVDNFLYRFYGMYGSIYFIYMIDNIIIKVDGDMKINLLSGTEDELSETIMFLKLKYE